MAKPALKTKAIDAPADRAEAEGMLAEIGRLQRRVSAVEGQMNEKLAEVKEKYEAKAAPLNAELKEKFRALHAWAEANKGEILKPGTKTARLATGEISWRTTPPSVRVARAPDVLKTLKTLGLTKFIRTKEEIDKEAMLADPERASAVSGVSITRREEFVVKPFESQLERVEVVRR